MLALPLPGRGSGRRSAFFHSSYSAPYCTNNSFGTIYFAQMHIQPFLLVRCLFFCIRGSHTCARPTPGRIPRVISERKYESGHHPRRHVPFILLAIPSVPHLEALLLLRRDATQPWDGGRLAQRLYRGEKAAQALLADLHASGLLEHADEEALLYAYRPKSDELRQMIDRVAEMYAKNLIGVTNLIHSRTNKRAQQFVDAFIWRKGS